MKSDELWNNIAIGLAVSAAAFCITFFWLGAGGWTVQNRNEQPLIAIIAIIAAVGSAALSYAFLSAFKLWLENLEKTSTQFRVGLLLRFWVVVLTIAVLYLFYLQVPRLPFLQFLMLK